MSYSGLTITKKEYQELKKYFNTKIRIRVRNGIEHLYIWDSNKNKFVYDTCNIQLYLNR